MLPERIRFQGAMQNALTESMKNLALRKGLHSHSSCLVE